eukprot:scpid106863/ scgid20357/ 
MASLHSQVADVEEQPSILHHALSSDFQFVRVLAHGSQGSVFAVRCTLGGLPPNKLYALKLFYHDKLSWRSEFRSTGGRSRIPVGVAQARPTHLREHESRISSPVAAVAADCGRPTHLREHESRISSPVAAVAADC